jgi:hypothetical protein
MFRVLGLELGAQGLGEWGLGFRVQGLGYSVKDSKC